MKTIDNRKAKQQNKRFWDIRNAINDAPPELILYGEIASTSWWGDEVTPKMFADELSALGTVDEIVVRINSGGGDVFAANAIFTLLKDNPASITVKIDGWAASAATIIAMAGDVVEISRAGVFMVHDPLLGMRGYFNESDLEDATKELKVIKKSIVNAYAMKSQKDEEEIAALMAAETWYTGDAAVAEGFCDKLMFEDVDISVENTSKVIINNVNMDLSGFRALPTSLIDRIACGTKNNNNEGEEQMSTLPKTIKTVDELCAAYPDLVAQVEKNAVEKERQRIQDIEDVALPGFDHIVNNAKFKDPIAAGDVAKAILAEQKKQGSDYLAKRDEDAKKSNTGEVGGVGREGTANKSVSEIDAVIDKVLPEEK